MGGGIGSALASGNDESNAVMRELVQRETVCRTRISVLQSTGKQFEKDINAFLQLMKDVTRIKTTTKLASWSPFRILVNNAKCLASFTRKVDKNSLYKKKKYRKKRIIEKKRNK